MSDFDAEKDRNDELRQEWERDQLLEEQKEINEQPMRNWIKDNLIDLRRDFCIDNEDEFDEYCKEAWRHWKE